MDAYRRSRTNLGSSRSLGLLLGSINATGERFSFWLGEDGVFKGGVVPDVGIFALGVEIAIHMNLQLGRELDLLLRFIAEPDGLVAFVELLLLNGLLSRSIEPFFLQQQRRLLREEVTNLLAPGEIGHLDDIAGIILNEPLAYCLDPVTIFFPGDKEIIHLLIPDKHAERPPFQGRDCPEHLDPAFLHFPIVDLGKSQWSILDLEALDLPLLAILVPPLEVESDDCLGLPGG